jgi:hypothetical protein
MCIDFSYVKARAYRHVPQTFHNKNNTIMNLFSLSLTHSLTRPDNATKMNTEQININ